MPATSARQQKAMAIAEHHPDALYKRNRGMLQMTHGQLHDFAATKGLGRSQAPKAPAKSNPNRYRLIRATGIGMQRNKML